jgi:hypothetical protein
MYGMKKNICALLVFFLVVLAVAVGADSDMGEISDLIREDLFRNAGKIEETSGTLTEMERFTLYSHFEKDSRLPFVMNLAIGVGLGSFIQGDTAGAVIALAGDVVGVALPLLGYACLMQDYYGYWDFPYGYELMYAGYAVIGITRIFESIRPYNTTLRKSLRYSDGPSLSLIPSLNTKGVILAIRLPLPIS